MSNNRQVIQKTKEENSFFIRLHHNWALSNEIFCNRPEYKGSAIKILQIMTLDEGYLLVECVYI